MTADQVSAGPVRRWMHDRGLLLVNLALFLLFLLGMTLTGWRDSNADQLQHGQGALTFVRYLTSGACYEAVFENWESEFLQMGMYVVLTAFLVQRGSSESRPIDGPAEQDADPRHADLMQDVPWPVRRGGWTLRIYQNSLAILFLLLFLGSVAGHAIAGAREYSEQELAHGGSAISAWQYLGTARFWFEAFQNWQSEFLSVAVIVGASVYLRQRSSPESKPVAAPHDETGA